MAKKTNQEKKMNPVLWILFAVIIPLIILIVIVAFILYITDFSIQNWAKDSNIPFMSNLVTHEEPVAETDVREESEEQAALLIEKDEEIEYLISVIDELEYTVTDLEQEVLRLENNLETEELEENEDEVAKGPSDIKKLAQSYEEMDEDRAAGILASMEDDQAVMILKEISTDIRGEILQEMEDELAATLSLLLIND